MESSFSNNRSVQPFIMLLVLFGLMAVSLYLSLELVKWSLPLLFNIPDGEAFINSVDTQILNPSATLYYQALVSPLGMFFLPALFYHILFRVDMADNMGLRHIPAAKLWVVGIGTMILAGIFIQLLVQLTAAVPLSGQWQVLRSGQEQVEKLINSFFADKSIGHLLLVILVLAVMPAIAEEICFRGTIQNMLAKTNLGQTWAIVVGGLTFAFMHLEFDNFLAIWCMGIVLGFLYYYSGSLWVSIAGHCLNNMVMVLMKYAFQIGAISSDIANSDSLPLYVTIPAGVLMIGGLLTMRRLSGRAVSDFNN